MLHRNSVFRGIIDLGSNNYLQYVGRDGLYVERGCVLVVTVDAVHNMEASADGAEFRLAVGKVLLQQHPFFDHDDPKVLNVSSIYLRECDDIISASGYVSWSIILNQKMLAEIRQAIGGISNNTGPGREDLDIYRICRIALQSSRESEKAK